MSESKTTATAVVTLTMTVTLSQPWPGEATLDEVHKRAKEEAMQLVGGIATEMAKREIRVSQPKSVRVILHSGERDE